MNYNPEINLTNTTEVITIPKTYFKLYKRDRITDVIGDI